MVDRPAAVSRTRTSTRVLEAHLNEELTPPDHLNQKLSSGLGEVVEFMMAKDRRKRYANADDLIIDLECLLSGDPPKLARKKIEAGTLRGLAGGRRRRGGERSVGTAVRPADAVGLDRRAGRPAGAERAGEPDPDAKAVRGPGIPSFGRAGQSGAMVTFFSSSPVFASHSRAVWSRLTVTI